MTLHGSDASQGAHVAQSLFFFLLGFLLQGPVGGLLLGVGYTCGKELPQVYAKLKAGDFDALLGDALDVVVHGGAVVLAYYLTLLLL